MMIHMLHPGHVIAQGFQLTAPAFQSAATLPATLLSYAPYDIQPAREDECGRMT
jgi:hypothetical protein